MERYNHLIILPTIFINVCRIALFVDFCDLKSVDSFVFEFVLGFWLVVYVLA